MRFVKLSESATMPTYATTGSVGADLYACVPITIYPGKVGLVHTGVALDFEGVNLEATVRPRSGLSFKGILGLLGTIDRDYTGELKVGLYNTTNFPYQVEVGQRVAQVVISPCVMVADAIVVDTTPRGERGLGSSGV